MCKCFRVAFAVLLVGAGVTAMFDLATGELLLLKTVEGVLGGLLFGLIAGLDKWLRFRRHGFPFCRFKCLLRREVQVGLCAGFLVGAVLSLCAILTR